MKKSLGLAVMGMMFLATPVFASSGGENSRTETKTNFNGETKLEVSIDQDANVKNEVTENINTGENVTSHNRGAEEKLVTGSANVSIDTGAAEAKVEVENKVNTAKVEVGQEKEEEEKESEEGQSPAEVEVPQAAQGAAAAEVPGEVSGQLAAETLPETGANSIGLALLLSGILLLAGYDLKKFFELKRSNLI